MIKLLRFFGLSLFAWLFLAACSSAAAPTPTGEVVEIVAGRPTAPASGDEFREDSADQVAATGRPQLIQVFAYDCIVCIQIKPMVHRLESDYWGKIDFVYLEQFDTRNRSVFEQYGLVGRPVFVLIEPDGTEVEQWFGARDEAEIRAVLDTYLAG